MSDTHHNEYLERLLQWAEGVQAYNEKHGYHEKCDHQQKEQLSKRKASANKPEPDLWHNNGGVSWTEKLPLLIRDIKRLMQRLELAEDEVNQVYNRAGSIYEQRLGLYGADHTAQETNGSDTMLYTTYFSSQVPLNPVPVGEHRLPPLPYAYDALEPYIDRETMRIHHLALHQNYVDGLNRAERAMERARNENDYDLLRHWEREAAFNGAGHYLHTIFWFNMHPEGGGEPTGDLREQINRDFGSFERFKAHFTNAAEKVEGPGWALLVWSPRAHRLEILQAEKHHLLSQQDIIPLMALDVWEHAYFLKYKDDRAAYISNWWNIVNWDYIQDRYKTARTIRWEPY